MGKLMKMRPALAVRKMSVLVLRFVEMGKRKGEKPAKTVPKMCHNAKTSKNAETEASITVKRATTEF